MRFLYKIYSGYDGFRPAVIPRRMHEGRLTLGWQHYIDVVEKGWECWVYFHGPHQFENGVYAQGIVDGIDLEEREVSLRIRRHSTVSPITAPEVSERIATVVAPRKRQVFIWPEEWNVVPQCSLRACKRRRCADCPTWAGLRRIPPGHAQAPARLRRTHHYHAIVSAHWIVPRRCYYSGFGSDIHQLRSRFAAFKLGEMDYAYPFARAMFEQLRIRDLLDFDYVVPIPLSPDKAANGEAHRTRALARELGRLLAVKTREMLRLTKNISKRRLLALGYTPPQFEVAYRRALDADIPNDASSILLVDDVMTHGSTAAQALSVIHAQRPETRIVVATAGQMIVKAAVLNTQGFKA